jgi:hypothetical protein
MKRLLLVLLLFAASSASAQMYISFSPSILNSPGTFWGKFNPTVEVGRQTDCFSIGLDIGKLNCGKVAGRDTTAYLEVRPNLNVFQQGKFTNTLTIGLGYIFNAQESMLTELTSGVEYAHTEHLHFNIYFGQFFFSGRRVSSDATFFGASAMWYFVAYKPKSLISRN